MMYIEIDKARRKRALEEANKVLDNGQYRRESWDPLIGAILLTIVMILIMSFLTV